jgi:hypothetical protein
MNTLASSDTGSTVLGFAIWAAVIVAYWTPTIVAVCRWKHIPNGGGVIVVNGLLGWTFIGWIVALVMAVRSRPQPLHIQMGQPPYGFTLPQQRPFPSPTGQNPQQPW